MIHISNHESVRVATLNLFGHHGPWDDRREVLVNGFRDLQPDLMSFQEVITTDGYDQIADILGDEHHIVHQRDGKVDDNGAAIASRWPISQVHELDLTVTPRTADFPCTALIAEIDAPQPFGPLLFVNHHPNWQLDFEYERELQTVIVARFIESKLRDQDRHVIIAGDLDADHQAASIRFWTGRQSLDGMSVCYRDGWESKHPGKPGHTFTSENGLMVDWDWPFGRIDHILVKCGLHGGPTLAIDACERIFDQPVNDVWASDHFGVLADLTIPSPKYGNQIDDQH